jgi:ribonuclease HII
VEEITVVPDILYMDGNNKIKACRWKQIVEPKADVKYQQVSAASIIAKHLRDTMMIDYANARKAKGLSDYGWVRNKGYGTPDHLEAIRKHGLVVDSEDSTTDHRGYLHRLRYCRKVQLP